MLQLDDNWRLRPDSMCWVLEKRLVNKESHEASWHNKGYYPLLEDALRGACNHMMKSTRDIANLMTEIDRLHKMIHEVCVNNASAKTDSQDDIDFLD